MYFTFSRRFWATVCKTVRPVLSVRCLSVCLSVTLVYCGQTVGWIKVKLGRQIGLGPWPHCVIWDPAPPKKAHSPPHFLAHVYCGQTAGWIKMPLGRNLGLGPGNIELDADPAPPPRGTTPNFPPMCVVTKWLNGSRCHSVRRYVSLCNMGT